MPSNTANEAASEKLSTVVMDMTVDARHRLRAFSTGERELMLCEGVGGMVMVMRGRSENITKEDGQTI